MRDDGPLTRLFIMRHLTDMARQLDFICGQKVNETYTSSAIMALRRLQPPDDILRRGCRLIRRAPRLAGVSMIEAFINLGRLYDSERHHAYNESGVGFHEQ